MIKWKHVVTKLRTAELMKICTIFDVLITLTYMYSWEVLNAGALLAFSERGIYGKASEYFLQHCCNDSSCLFRPWGQPSESCASGGRTKSQSSSCAKTHSNVQLKALTVSDLTWSRWLSKVTNYPLCAALQRNTVRQNTIKIMTLLKEKKKNHLICPTQTRGLIFSPAAHFVLYHLNNLF